MRLSSAEDRQDASQARSSPDWSSASLTRTPENGFCVLRVKARGHRELVSLVGHAAVISAGEWVTATGNWVNDRTHGQKFKARFLKTSAPTSIEGSV